jgi:hypothetical protein
MRNGESGSLRAPDRGPSRPWSDRPKADARTGPEPSQPKRASDVTQHALGVFDLPKLTSDLTQPRWLPARTRKPFDSSPSPRVLRNQVENASDSRFPSWLLSWSPYQPEVPTGEMHCAAGDSDVEVAGTNPSERAAPRPGWSPTWLPRAHPVLISSSNGTTLASGGFFRSSYADSRVAGTASRSRYTPISCSRILIRC